MTEREAFHKAIQGNPADRTNQLVFADWLDDHDCHLEAAIRRATWAIAFWTPFATSSQIVAEFVWPKLNYIQELMAFDSDWPLLQKYRDIQVTHAHVPGADPVVTNIWELTCIKPGDNGMDVVTALCDPIDYPLVIETEVINATSRKLSGEWAAIIV